MLEPLGNWIVVRVVGSELPSAYFMVFHGVHWRVPYRGVESLLLNGSCWACFLTGDGS